MKYSRKEKNEYVKRNGGGQAEKQGGGKTVEEGKDGKRGKIDRRQQDGIGQKVKVQQKI